MQAPALFAANPSIELNTASAHHMTIKSLENGGYEITTTGNDPHVISEPLAETYDPNKHYVLSFEYISMKGADFVQLFYGPPIKGSQSAMGDELLSSEGWTSYSLNIRAKQEPKSWRGGFKQFRLDFGHHSGRTIRIRNICLRPPTAEETKLLANAKKRKELISAFDERLQAMVKAKHRSKIARVVATPMTMEITVDLPNDMEDIVLCEVPFYQSPLQREFVWQKPLKAGSQTIRVKRLRNSYDRVFSSWILMKKGKEFVPVSHQRFVDAMPAKWALNRMHPKTKKGTTGLSNGNALFKDDYAKLGVHSATKNIILPALVSDKPSKHTKPHTLNGVTVHINQNALAGLDQSMLAMDSFGTVVSAIILIPKKTPMSHPGCTAQGIYAMANVVEANGWSTYAAGLDFLAQRYMRPDKKYGRITHWILHNEIDAGWVWTNAGEIPVDTYLDLYYRSMRTAQSVIRRYGNAGQVLMSLTHHWTARHNSKCYPPKSLVDLLAKRSQLEGNFDWGLAYHPYPQNLRDPRTWLDNKVTYDFYTPFITPKNLEVLDVYMKQKNMTSAGQVRTIVLSEQGSNSKGHDAQSYRDQAAGLVYTWLKMQSMDSIESYIHHRWMDHPEEGGLNLGFRRHSKTPNEAAQKASAVVFEELAKFGVKSTPDETKKPAWEVFRLLDTKDQAKVEKWSKTVIPAQHFKDIPAKVQHPK